MLRDAWGGRCGIEDIALPSYLTSMTTTVKKLAAQALKLPTEARAQLADLLVESLDASDIGRIEQLWVTEALRRRDEIRSGIVQPVSSEEAASRIRNILGK